MQKRHFFSDQFQWNYGQFLEFHGSYLKLGWNCCQFHLSLLKSCTWCVFEKSGQNCYIKKRYFIQKNDENSSSFKKVHFDQKMSANFHFLSPFFRFWNCKMSFFASEKITTRYVCFFRCKLTRNFRAGNPLLLCTGGETGKNNCPKWKLYNFALKLEHLLENIKIVLPVVHNLRF